MSINLIFRIAAVGILVSVLGQVLKHAGREEQAFLVSPVRTDPGAFVGDPLYIGVVPVDTGAVYLVAGQNGEAQWKRLL